MLDKIAIKINEINTVLLQNGLDEISEISFTPQTLNFLARSDPTFISFPYNWRLSDYKIAGVPVRDKMQEKAMDHNPPTAGEIAMSNAYRNQDSIRRLETRVGDLEAMELRLIESIENLAKALENYSKLRSRPKP
jgi:hypothetical protein